MKSLNLARLIKEDPESLAGPTRRMCGDEMRAPAWLAGSSQTNYRVTAQLVFLFFFRDHHM